MVAGIGLAPILKHPPQPSPGDIGLKHAFRCIDQPEAGKRGIDLLRCGTEGELPFDAHPDLAAVLVELPGIDIVMPGQAQIDAIVPEQILGFLRFRPVLEV